MEEEWRPVPGYEGLYEVSNLGRVRSHDRWVLRGFGRKALWKGRILKPRLGSKGHLFVTLYNEDNGSHRSVHRLVAEAFLPNPEALPVARHLDDDKENNRLDNLSWGTFRDNSQDALRNGRRYGQHNARKTHCPQGHEYNLENTGRTGRSRYCKTCKREQSQINKRRRT